jgi:hypothetical protein
MAKTNWPVPEGVPVKIPVFGSMARLGEAGIGAVDEYGNTKGTGVKGGADGGDGAGLL